MTGKNNKLKLLLKKENRILYRNRAVNLVFISIFALIISFFLSGLSSCNLRTLERFEETREMMGTYVTITIYADQEDSREVMEAGFKRMQEIIDIVSIYDEDSEMSSLNKNGFIEDPSAELKELINLSIEYYNISSGSFDITIKPVLTLWSEGLWKESEEVQAAEIQQALKLVGSDKIIIEDNKIYFTIEGMSADLGGIAKGYIVDKALEVISEYGIEHALVNAGGDVASIGSEADGEKWLVELDDPDGVDNSIGGSDALPSFMFEDMAVATSGNYYRYYDPEKEVHHITDPMTGYSANRCISVTIIADSCMKADVLATTVFIKGPVEGMELVEKMDGIEAFIIDNDRNMYQSSGLLKYLK